MAYYLEPSLPVYRNFQFGFTHIVFTTIKENMCLGKKSNLFFLHEKKSIHVKHAACIKIDMKHVNTHTHTKSHIYINSSTYLHT